MASLPLELPVDIPGLEIPEPYLSVIPSSDVNTPVNRFRFHVLQEQRGGLVFPPAETSFSTSPPSGTYDLSKLAKHPIPPAKYLQSLKTYLSNSSNDARLGFRSIHNFANHEELLPLWVLTIWDKISLLVESRDRWMQAFLWVMRLQAAHQEDKGTQLARAYFEVIGWGSQLSLYGLRGITNLALAQFLSDGRINAEAVDLMARFLLSSPSLPAGVLVLDLRLSNFLSTVDLQKAGNHPPPPHIQDLENQLVRVNAFYFPVFHAKYDHWIAFKVDVLRREVIYGTLYITWAPPSKL